MDNFKTIINQSINQFIQFNYPFKRTIVDLLLISDHMISIENEIIN